MHDPIYKEQMRTLMKTVKEMSVFMEEMKPLMEKIEKTFALPENKEEKKTK